MSFRELRRVYDGVEWLVDHSGKRNWPEAFWGCGGCQEEIVSVCTKRPVFTALVAAVFLVVFFSLFAVVAISDDTRWQVEVDNYYVDAYCVPGLSRYGVAQVRAQLVVMINVVSRVWQSSVKYGWVACLIHQHGAVVKDAICHL